MIRHRNIEVATRGPGLYEFTYDVRAIAGKLSTGEGMLSLFVRHTSCSLLIQENADPDVVRDLNEFFRRLAPPSDDPSMSWVRHRAEGPDDMPAHIRAALTPVSISIPISDGRLMLGTWQGVYLFEHRDAPMRRTVIASLAG